MSSRLTVLLLAFLLGGKGLCVSAAESSASRSDSSAVARNHWAFQAPVGHQARPGISSEWSRSAIDSLLSSKLQERGFRAQSEAAPEIWLRRVTLDLIGLPPSPEAIQEYTRDPSELARQRIIDSLLSRPEFGERWGRHLMDLWRYSDWWGLDAQLRYSQKHLWHWRDWIIESLNHDKGYDRMIIEMLAADEESPEDTDRLRATGFLCRSYYLFNRTTWLDEVVEHTGRAFLGLTFQCMKCHDHKYDPLLQTDYYKMRAVFEPYHVRLDAWPEEVDFEKNGLPRIYDLHNDTPTYVHLRGDDKQPLTNHIIQPGIPAVFGEVKITPVPLPPTAFFPGLKEQVLKDQVKAAEARIQAQKSKADAAREALKGAALQSQYKPSAVVTNPTTSGPLPPVLTDDFRQMRPELWETGDGHWQVVSNGLVQDAAKGSRGWIRSRASHPSNFHARVSLTILGGDVWKSVGLSFDALENRETLAYISAHPPGKAQIALGKGTDYQYPAGAEKELPIRTGVVHTLDLKVQGDLLNLSVNGEHAVVYRLPRREAGGHIQLITYDAQAQFHNLTLSPLAPDAQLLPAAGSPSVDPLREAELTLALANAELLSTQAQLDQIKTAWVSDRVKHGLPGRLPGQNQNSGDDLKQLSERAADADLRLSQARKQAAIAQIDLDLAKAPSDKKTELEAKLKKAQEELASLVKTNAAATAAYTSIRGSLKALEGPTDAFDKNPAEFPAVSSGRRLALARWIASPTNPLTARVMVNQVWTRLLGDSLVADVSDFGLRAKPPLHQDILDTLAVDFMSHGWSFKSLIRQIVSSRAYRSTSTAAAADPEALRLDPENHYYWRMNSKRLDSQAIRDSLLQVAQLLDPTRGGPSVPVPGSEDSHRRALYFQQHGELEHRFLASFDNANVFECYRRRESVTPQQALTLANSRLTLECAESLEKTLRSKTPPSGPEIKATASGQALFVGDAFLAILGRRPHPDEIRASEESLKALAVLQPSAMDEKRVRVLFLLALMNHNDFITLR